MAWFLSIVFSFLCSIALTPLVAKVARRVGLVDRPDGHRKLHGREVALGGGVAVLLSVLIVIIASGAFVPAVRSALLYRWLPMGAVALAAFILCLIGLADDRYGIRGRQKLLGQIFACVLAVSGGSIIEKFVLFGHTWELGIFAFPITCLWLLAIINAMNLIDGADGLASTVGIVISIAFAIMAHMLGHPMESLVACMLAGALGGFLVYNRPPAMIFLGDAGSMTIGLLLGVLAIRSSLKGPATVAITAATAIWAIVFFDVLMALARRKLTGRSLYTVDRGHIHHVLQNRGFSPGKTVLIIGLACIICSVGALVSVALKSETIAIISTLTVLGAFVGTRLFGFHECDLFIRRVKSFLRSLLMKIPRGQDDISEKGQSVCSRFQGNREWELLWDSLIEYAERFELSKVQLNISSPVISEEYHAVWNSHHEQEDENSWSMDVPFFSDDKRVGCMSLVGKSLKGESNFHWLADLAEGLHAFEIQFSEIIERELIEEPEESVSMTEPRVESDTITAI